MRIAILTSGVLPVPAVQGGAVENLIDFCIDYNNRHHLHDITVYSIPPRISLWTKIMRKWYSMTHQGGYYHPTIEFFLHETMKDICRKKYDIIILENRPGYALKLKEVTDAPLVYHLHNDLLNSETKNAHKLYDAASSIITVSDFIHRRIQTINPRDTKTITVFNGIDIHKFATNKRLTPKVGQPFILIFMGRIIPEKGIEQLIDAMLQLQQYNDIHLIVAGGSFYANSMPNAFSQQLHKKSESIGNRILFTGYINQEKLHEYLQLADAAVLPSIWDEPFGLTCVEAMAAGLPLITTRSGGIPEICKGVATIVERDDIVNNLVTAILDLYEHPEKREQMAAAGLSHAKLFDKDTYAKNFFKALENI
jgi:glycosyltransferase involved in cell wall biosynthesis